MKFELEQHEYRYIRYLTEALQKSLSFRNVGGSNASAGIRKLLIRSLTKQTKNTFAVDQS